MIRNRILAALLALPLSACTVEDLETAAPAERPEEMSTGSTADVKAALSLVPNARVLGAHADGVPFFVKGEFGSTGNALNGLVARSVHARLAEPLRRIAPIFRLEAAELVVQHTSTDELGHTHVRYAQTKNGRPVVGHELIVHVDPAGLVYAANGSARGGDQAATQESTTAEVAIKAALGSTEGTQLGAESARLVYYRAEADGPLALAYEVVVTGEGATLPIRDHVFVDAGNNAVLGRATDIHAALNRLVHTANNKTSLPGTVVRREGGAASGDTHVDENYDHLGTTYECFKQNFNRDSYNNAGAQLKSSVHYSTNYTNAFWNGSQMVYGDSDGVDAGPLGKSLDVTVHELTHAVTSASSNLTYANESGALNEGMSDIFAAYCESWTKGWSMDAPIWMIGDDIWTPNEPGDALRYMANPTQDGSSTDYYPERYTGSQDNGGVHWNSGIANLAFKLLSTGGTHPRNKTTIQVPGLGVQAAGAIFYRANNQYMTASTTFAQAKAYMVQAATDLNSNTAAVTAAWDAVGVGGTTTPPPPACTSTVALTNGTAVSGISVAAGDWSCTYTLVVPSGASALSFTTSGGTGDADLYVKLGSAPTESSNDCKSLGGTNAETCTIPTATAGTYYVKIKGYSAASGITLKGAFTAGSSGGGTVLTNGVETASFSGTSGSWNCYTLVIPSGKTSAVFTQAAKSGATGDADLYVRLGSKPTTSTYNCRPYKSGSAESCTISNPSAGTWHVCSYGYSTFTNVTLKGAY